MTPPTLIRVPDLDVIDSRVRQGEKIEADQITRLTRLVRRLVELLVNSGGGGLIAPMAEGTN